MLYAPHSVTAVGINPPPNPAHGPWRRLGAQSVEADIRVLGCQLMCPANITVSNDANQCGAGVTYAAPTTAGLCGMVTCSPKSGSFFQIGTTTVTCTAQSGQSCSFTVTVNDTQAPSITGPTNITVPNAPNQCSATVTYTTPKPSDNCSGAMLISCVPASGSFFPTGTTTVTCTARDAAGNTNMCAFMVTVNAPTSVCIRDDYSGDTFFEVVDAASPLYGFWRYRRASGTVYCAKAEYTSYIPGRSLISWNRTNPIYFMDCNANLAARTATVRVTVRATNTVFTLRDSNTSNNPACVLN